MIDIENDSIISRHSEIVFNKLDDEIVMMSVQNGEYYGLDNIGSRVWEIIEKPVSFMQIISVLEEEYKVLEEQCINDVKEFLILLKKKDLIYINKC